MTGVSKAFGPVQALLEASIELRRGEIHALVGENGSGKSTLVGVASGTVKADAGSVFIDGVECTRHQPSESEAMGAITVFQDGSIIPELTIAQNLYLGTPAAQRPNYRAIESWAKGRLEPFGLGHLPFDRPAEVLAPAERQLFEFGRAMSASPRVLMLDEATSALDAAGVDIALKMMKTSAEAGTAVLFVTHRLSEVFRVADRISVLRDGIWLGTRDAKELTSSSLVELMAGTSVDVEFPDHATADRIGEVVLDARGLAGPRFGPVDLSVRGGEILGIAGAADNGQRELIRALAAVDAPEGELEISGKPVISYSGAVGAGALLLSEDRRRESLMTSLSIRENLTVGMLGKLSSLSLISWPREKGLVNETVDRFGIRLGSAEDPITSLSGGNQQKVALGRSLATNPRVILIEEPTQGVDVRSRMDIYRMLRASADEGLGLILISSDAAELAGMCDRVMVLSRGRMVAELSDQESSERRIVEAFAEAGHVEGESIEQLVATEEAVEPPKPGFFARLRTGASGRTELLRLLMLATFIVLLGAFAQSENDSFLTNLNIYNLLFLAVPLAMLAAAEFIVLYVGGIDISVGGAMAVCIVVMSFLVQDQALIPALVISIALAVGVGLVVGSVNATLVEGLEISPVIATIATLGILQGVGLAMRPVAGGLISPHLIDGLSAKIWVFPWPLVVLIVFFVVGDWALRSTGIGLRLRSVGLNPQFAHRLGVPAKRFRKIAYVGCAIGAAIAGILLSAQVGIGDPTVGNNYTLLAIAAPVIGGASLFGGYGSFSGCILGAVLLVLAQSLTTTLGIEEAYSYVFTGALTLLAILLYTAGAGTALVTAFRTAKRRLTVSPGESAEVA